jgi:hypothetical protein
VGKGWMPILAGILDIIFCFPVFLFVVFATLLGISLSGGAMTPWDVASVLQVATAFALVSLAFVGAVYAMMRRKWKLALAGSISAFLPGAGSIYIMLLLSTDRPISTFEYSGIIVLASIPIILTAISKSEFK